MAKNTKKANQTKSLSTGRAQLLKGTYENSDHIREIKKGGIYQRPPALIPWKSEEEQKPTPESVEIINGNRRKKKTSSGKRNLNKK